MKKRVLFLMSDTGGGHRAAAEAIQESLVRRYPNDVDVALVDVFRDYTPFPFRNFPELYPWLVNHGKSSWGASFKLTNTRQRAKILTSTMYMTAESGLKQMLRDHPADVVVSVHSLLTHIAMRAMLSLQKRPPFVVVVTDLVSTHYFWYDRRADRTLLPTQIAFERGLKAGLDPNKMRVTGLPVHPRFTDALTDKATARAALGWHPTLPTILLVGGGDGMGPVYKIARAIDERGLQCQLVIVCGRNATLKAQADTALWNQPTHIYGFVSDMPRLMAGSDVIATKAGPATISEACIAGLPMLLYDAIPGQEEGNVDFVIENNAGVYITQPRAAAETVEAWLSEGETYLRWRSANARRAARPDAAWQIADELWDQAQRPLIAADRRKKLTLKDMAEQIGIEL
ncbi:MAG: glycosyltransferase [Chloroflexota bacterium]|nr:glycosyltransferase [Chloroflexota bacterium]